MPDQVFTLIKGDRIGTETDYRDALPVNMTAISKPIFGAQGYMLQEPGLTQYATGEGIDRGGLWNERQRNHYRVSGGKFIQVSENGVTQVLGNVTGTDTVSLPYSFNTQGIVADGRFYLFDNTNGFREVNDPDLGDPIDAVWVDGFYFFTDGDFIYHTNIADESQIDPLQFATAEFMPDPSNGVAKTVDNKVMVFGRYTTEFFINDASTNFSFSRVETRALKIGIVGTYCKAEMSDTWYIMGGRKEESVSVHALGVGSAAKVATREVDKIIGLYDEDQLFTAVVEARVDDNYSHLLIHLPNHVLLFNETIARVAGIEQAWTILKTDAEGDTPWRGKHGVFEPRRGEWVYGDKQDGRIGVYDDTVVTHYGQIVEWLLFTPFLFLDSTSVDKLEIEVTPGHNVNDDATVAMSLSYDGVTFGKEWFELYGTPGEYRKRFILRRLGYVADWLGIKLRGVTSSRMAFSRGFVSYG